jgi:hypothetical protein
MWQRQSYNRAIRWSLAFQGFPRFACRICSSGVGRVPGAEEVPEPEGKLIMFEAFFTAGLCLPAHRFVSKVLQRFEVQVHQLTPNAVVALAKYVWAATSYGGQPSVEVFAKH